jgi:predicted ATP-grasp superfamily ATP-dependent carboligase
MSSVLILGARSPAALELCRRFAAQGITVFAADSLRFPLARWSNAVSSYLRLPSPRHDRNAFGVALSVAILAHEIDLVIPTCEEAFHLAAIKDSLPKTARYFVDDLATLDRLHNKSTIQDMLIQGGILQGPQTARLTGRAAVRQIDSCRKINGKRADDLVYKRVYSRFSEGTFVRPDKRKLDAIVPTEATPFVVQEFIAGTEICVYAAATFGEVGAITAYRSVYRAGLGAGIYFEPVHDADVLEGVSEFIQHHSLHGQISFDIIRSHRDDRLYVIECNPRATSGIHLIEDAADMASTYGLTQLTGATYHGVTSPKMVGLAIVTYGIQNLKSARSFIANIRRASDVIWSRIDNWPVFGQFIAMTELLALAWKQRISPLAATTYDIEWNGSNE